MLMRMDRDQRASFQMNACGFTCAHYGVSNGIRELAREERRPQRAEIHVDEDLHAAGIGSSISSTRHAA